MNNVAELKPRTDFKDGDGGFASGARYVIDVVENGYIIDLYDDENGDTKYVFTSKADILDFLKEFL